MPWWIVLRWINVTKDFSNPRLLFQVTTSTLLPFSPEMRSTKIRIAQSLYTYFIHSKHVSLKSWKLLGTFRIGLFSVNFLFLRKPTCEICVCMCLRSGIRYGEHNPEVENRRGENNCRHPLPLVSISKTNGNYLSKWNGKPHECFWRKQIEKMWLWKQTHSHTHASIIFFMMAFY